MAILNTRQVAAIGVMGALATIATMIFTFPIPATSGYFNLGDTIVIITSLTFGPVVGALAGGLGSGLADLLGGWYNWVIFTTLIKGAEGAVAGYLAGDPATRTLQKTIVAWLVGGVMMVGGYFVVQVFMYGVTAAVSELPFNMLQMTGAGLIGIPISNALKDRLKL
ncbi:ECF transporter S component [Candidatus Bathyarchaeota archaeon]|nr:ECF transporter S component [Candidatus Bathyarchaeota archaeon]